MKFWIHFSLSTCFCDGWKTKARQSLFEKKKKKILAINTISCLDLSSLNKIRRLSSEDACDLNLKVNPSLGP